MKNKFFIFFSAIGLTMIVTLLSIWQPALSYFFDKTSMNIVFKTGSIPVISQVAVPKNYFIDLAGGINLKDYATAFDKKDGDITDKIVVDSTPEFNHNKAGEYKISYNVKNSDGKMAQPLQIDIRIWDFVKIASGNYHTLALTSHGKVYAWGYNIYGQIGDGTINYVDTPKLVEGLDNIVDVAAGTGSSFALDSLGRVYAWGRNDNGRLGCGDTANKNRPTPIQLSQDIKIKQISARFGTGGVVADNGDVYTWGYGGYGALGDGRTSDVFIPTKIGVENVIRLELGQYNGAAITADGVLYTWGDNLHGQLGNGSNMVVSTHAPKIVDFFADKNINPIDVSVGLYHMTLTTDDGSLYTWGYGLEGRLGINSTADKNTPQLVAMPSRIIKAQAAYYHTAALTENGEIYFFGQNAYGKHGSGNATNHLSPFLLESMKNVSDFSLALDSSFVLIDGRMVYGMGYGGTGVLGTGSSTNSTVPVKWAFSPPPPS